MFFIRHNFWRVKQTLQCARAQANMLHIQCFSLEFCLQCPAWANFEDWQLGSILAYKDTQYLI